MSINTNLQQIVELCQAQGVAVTSEQVVTILCQANIVAYHSEMNMQKLFDDGLGWETQYSDDEGN